MVHPHLIAKDLPEPHDDLCCQGNFRQQVKHLPSLFQLFHDEADIDLCFPAGGNTVQHDYILLFKIFSDSVQGFLLIIVQ